MNNHMREITKECVESSDEWQAYIQELIRKDGAHKLQVLLENGIDVDIVKKSAAIYFYPNEIDGIIEKIQNEIKESKINGREKMLPAKEAPLCTREEVLQIALRKVNQGYCLQYVSAGLKEWLGVEISPDELDTELSEQPGLLSSYQRLRNAWYNIRHVESESITPLQIQEKYGFDWRYQEYILEPREDVDKQDSDSAAELAPTDEVQTLSKQIIDKNREAYESLASADKERPE